MTLTETYEQWITRIMGEYPHTKGTQRYGQFLYNNLPDRFMGVVPFAIDPFYKDDHVEDFLNWVRRHW